MSGKHVFQGLFEGCVGGGGEQGVLFVAGKLLEDVFCVHGIVLGGELGIGGQAHGQTSAGVLRALAGVVHRQPRLHIHGIAGVQRPIGAEPYRFLAEKYGIPGVITGFEPVDVLQGIAMIMRQLHEGRAEIEIAYARGVMPEGNPVALAAIDEVFETCSATWRGLGEIPGSGYRIREEFADFDAMRRFQPDVEEVREHKGCRCGDVLRGIMAPSECPLFRTVCTPENPVGPCMVSSEGSCAAYYRYY